MSLYTDGTYKRSLPKPQSGKMTQVPMFTSKGCDIGRGDARRVDNNNNNNK